MPFSPASVLVVPARESHWVGQAGSQAQVAKAADRCALFGDGFVEFTAGDGADDTLMVCGALSAPYPGALSLFELLRAPLAADRAASCVPASAFEAMMDEIGGAGLGTQAMCQALMKQGLIALLRGRWGHDEGGRLLAGAVLDPRLARAIAAIIENPAAAHTVDSLASLAGMSRASFSDHFSRAFGQGPIDFVQKARRAIARSNRVQLAYCWAHVRRAFFKIAASRPVAAEALVRIAGLYAIKQEVRGRSPDERRAARQELSTPVVADLRRFLDVSLARTSRKSKLADAIRYALTRWTGLSRFLDDGRIEIDSNTVERSIRPLAFNRKNALFAGSDDGGDYWAVIANMIETCKLSGTNPQIWLADTLTRLAAGHGTTALDQLMPWNHATAVT